MMMSKPQKKKCKCMCRLLTQTFSLSSLGDCSGT